MSLADSGVPFLELVMGQGEGNLVFPIRDTAAVPWHWIGGRRPCEMRQNQKKTQCVGFPVHTCKPRSH